MPRLRLPAAVDGMPETFVGLPAVIASTTACCVVVAAVEDADVPSEPEHGDPVGRLEDVVEVVRDDHDAETLLAEAADEREHLLGLRHAEGGGRLVEDDELRVPLDGLRDGDGLALAAGERRDRLPDRRDRRHREALERRGGGVLHRRLVEDLEPVGLAAEVHVLDDVEVVAEGEILVDDLDPEPRRVLRAVDVHLLALEDDLAAVGRVGARDALDQRRLAGAVVADERHHLAGAHLEVDVGQRLDRAEGLGDAAELEKWSVVSSSIRSRGGGAPRGASTADRA